MPEEVVAKVDDLKDGEMRDVKVGKRSVLLIRRGDRFYALGTKCPHYGAPLSDGLLHGEELYCPWHKSVFNALTGGMEQPPTLDSLGQFQVRVEGEDVLVTVPEDASSQRVPRMVGYKPSADNRHFVVVGGGAAGNAAVEAMREEGFAGRITMVTPEPDLPYDRPDLSKHFLASANQEKAPLLRSEDFYADHGIEVETGCTVRAVDVARKVVRLDDGSTLKPDAVLLATGGAPRRLDVPGGDLENVLTLRSLQDCYRMKDLAQEGARAVLVGASFIGMECAASLTERGVDVTVVAPEEQPFALSLGPEVGRAFAALHRDKGVDLRLGRSVDSFEGDGRVKAVVLDNGDRIEADFVLEGVGVRPVTDYIEGVDLNDDGSVDVDARLRVCDGVYAAGDIATFPDWRSGLRMRIEHWRLAEQHGRLAGRNMAGAGRDYRSVPYFWTMQFRSRMDYVGYAPDWDDLIIQGDVEERKFAAFYVKAGKVLAVAVAGNDVKACAALALMQRDEMPTPEQIRGGAELTDSL